MVTQGLCILHNVFCASAGDAARNAGFWGTAAGGGGGGRESLAAAAMAAQQQQQQQQQAAAVQAAAHRNRPLGAWPQQLQQPQVGEQFSSLQLRTLHLHHARSVLLKRLRAVHK